MARAGIDRADEARRAALRRLIENRRIGALYGRGARLRLLSGGRSEGDVAVAPVVDADHQVEHRRAEQ